MIQIVLKYQNYLDELEQLILNSKFKSSYLYKKLGLKKPTFYRKLKEKKWTNEEVMELTKILFPQEYYKHQLLKELSLSEEDIKNGDVLSADKYIEELKNEFLT